MLDIAQSVMIFLLALLIGTAWATYDHGRDIESLRRAIVQIRMDLLDCAERDMRVLNHERSVNTITRILEAHSNAD